jgi:hypothetical protein
MGRKSIVIGRREPSGTTGGNVPVTIRLYAGGTLTDRLETRPNSSAFATAGFTPVER